MELIKSKVKEENQKELMNQHKELIFKKNYGHKIYVHKLKIYQRIFH
jgi:hypothetical protein